MFSRSADWCPYCKTQLADLNRRVESFAKQGLRVASVTHDSRAILKSFAGRPGIKYTMISDPDSKVIRAFGILNPNEGRGTPNYGIPLPSAYIINERGVVTAKYFDDDYRERISTASIVTCEFGADGVLKETIENSRRDDKTHGIAESKS